MALLSKLPDLMAFLSQLPSSQLNGLHSLSLNKMHRPFPTITLDDATKLLDTLHSKTNFKHKKNWKKNQISLLLYLVDKACLKAGQNIFSLNTQTWKQISQLIPGKSFESCYSKALTLVPSNISECPWSQIEDQILSGLIQGDKPKHWKQISIELFERNPAKTYRTSKQCRERFMCFLKPDLKKGFWSPSEDYQLVCLYLEYGRKWSKIANFIEGRNENAIKNRFFLLFEESNKEHQYYSELLRKVNRKKQKLQKVLGPKMLQEPSITTKNSVLTQEKEEENEPILAAVEGRGEDITEYQKFFSF